MRHVGMALLLGAILLAVCGPAVAELYAIVVGVGVVLDRLPERLP